MLRKVSLVSRNETQEPWASAMIAAGAVDTRRRADVPSWTRLGEMAGVHTTTLTKMVAGKSKPTVETVEKIATALKVEPEVVSGWLGFEMPVRTPYEPPSEGALLTDRQRDALSEVIRSIAVEQRAGEGHEQRSAPMKPQDVQWPDPPQYDDPTRFYEDWDNIAATELARRATNYIQIIAQGLAPDSDVKPDDVTAWLEVAFAAGMAREMADGIKDSVKIALPTVDHLPTSGPLRDWYILAAHSGTAAHGKDTVTGEHSQDPDDYQP